MNIFAKAVFVTTIVFLLGLGTGMIIGKEQYSQFEGSLLELRTSVEETELQFLLMDVIQNEISCSFLNKEAEKLSRKAENLAEQVDKYEKTDRISGTMIFEAKSRYTSTLIKSWLMMEKIKQVCNSNYDIVLYFYSDKNCAMCMDQGILLSYYKLKMGQELMVFSIERDLGTNIVNGIVEVYNIKETPTLVINGEVYSGFVDKAQLEELFCENKSFEFCEN